MKYPDYPFVDFAKGDVRARNHVVTIREALVERDAGANHNSYITVYRFSEAYRDHVRETGSVARYVGPAYADYLPFDVDREGDLDEARRAVLALAVIVQETFDIGPDKLRYFFSGSKGFHLLVPTPLFGDVEPSRLLPTVFRTMAMAIADLAGVTIDVKIYDINRLFRMPETRHPATGLWKTELSWSELQTADIGALARERRRFDWQPHDIEPVEALAEFYAKHVYEAEQDAKAPPNARHTSEAGLAGDLAEVLRGGYVPDYRHRLVMAFAAYAAKCHLPRETALGTVEHLAAGDREMADRIRAVEDTYDKVRSGLSVRGYQELRDLLHADDLDRLSSLLGDHKPGKTEEKPERASQGERDSRVSLKHVYDADRAGVAYVDFVRTLAHRRVTLGIDSLDRKMRGLQPGTVTVLLAKARVGKSLFAQFVRRNISRTTTEGATVFFSLEMPIELVWERDAQFAFNTLGFEVEKRIAAADDAEVERLLAQVARNTPRSYTVPLPGLTIGEMESYCRLITDTYGHRINCVLVDYLSLVQAEGRDLYTITTKVARGLKFFAKAIDAPVIMLAQVRRRGADGEKIDGSTPPTLEDARDSGAIEEGADFVIGAWRPRIDQEYNDNEMVFRLLKNRLGQSGVDVYCEVEWQRMNLREKLPDELGPEPTSRAA